MSEGMTINQILGFDENATERKLADLPDEIRSVIKDGHYYLHNWWDAYSPLSQANYDRNFGIRGNPNNNAFKRKSLRSKLNKARERLEAQGFSPRTDNGMPRCAIKKLDDGTVIVVGLFVANVGIWNDDGEFEKAYDVKI